MNSTNVGDYTRCVVTITDSISPTSMPYNEFVLYRRKHFPHERQVLIILFETQVDKNVDYPADLEIIRCGKSLSKLRRIIKKIVLECNQRNAAYVFHVHEGKSVIFFNTATFGRYWEKVIYTLHSTYVNYPFHNKLFASIATHMCFRVACVSKTSFKYFPNYLKRAFRNRIIAIPNGVDTERVLNVVAQKEKEEHEVFRLIYVARLVGLKRHDILLDAVSKMHNVELVLIGKGPREEELRKIVAEKRISGQVSFLGALPREKVYAEIISSDAYVSSSSYEGLPISVLEAMCCGTPCIVSDIEQHLEIANECNALITVQDNVESWITTIDRLRDMSSDERKAIGNELQEGVIKDFSLNIMHEKYEKIYTLVWNKQR